jgi:hypothetical protein
MRLLRAFVLLAVAGLFLGGCASFFWATSEQPQNPVFKPYKHLYIGWVALPEDDWQGYGYPTKDEWVGQIRAFNTTGLQKYVKDWMPDVQVSGSPAEDQGMPSEGELYIRFTYHGLAQGYNAWSGGSDNLNLGVEFIDLGTKETVYQAQVVITSLGVFPRNWGSSTFDGRVDNQMYNLANWLKERLQG